MSENEEKSLDPLLALSALSEKATAGPWFIPANAPALIGDGDSVLAIFSGEWNHCTYNKQDAEFIAALVNWFRANTDDLRAANARGDGWLPIESAPEGEFLALVHGKAFPAFRVGSVIKAEYCNAPFVTPPTHWHPYPPTTGSEVKS